MEPLMFGKVWEWEFNGHEITYPCMLVKGAAGHQSISIATSQGNRQQKMTSHYNRPHRYKHTLHRSNEIISLKVLGIGEYVCIEIRQFWYAVVWHVNIVKDRIWYMYDDNPFMMTHQMETFSALLAVCAGNSPATGEFPTQRPVTRSFDFF